MKRKIWIIIPGVALIAVAAAFTIIKLKKTKETGEITQEIQPAYGDVRIFVSTTGMVEPQNRLEIKPTISGRVEEILVREGDTVKAGDTLALMSSTERATLLDAARLRDEETLRYWEDAYKPSPLIAPIDGKVIVRAVEPGQTVTTSTPVLVLSDRLIVKAQVDETDIGKVKLGQKAVITLDAYPGKKITAAVDHIAYESETVNNVTIYEVDILPDEVPPVFRSGMSANVDIIERSRQHVLTLPEPALKRKKGKSFVLVSRGTGKEPEEREVEIGLNNGELVEIISGIGEDERVLISSEAYTPFRGEEGGSPFTPWGRRRRSR